MNFEWMKSLSPMWGASLYALALVALTAWAWTRPRADILEGAQDDARWRDLRLWIVPLAAIQIGLYYFFS
jgi:hypothetical protein